MSESTLTQEFRFRRIGGRWLIEGQVFSVGEVVTISKRGGATTEQRITSTVEVDGVTYGVGIDVEEEGAAPRVAVRIPYEAADVRAQAKRLGARWNSAQKVWMVPAEHAAEIQEAAGDPRAERELLDGEKRWSADFCTEVPFWVARTVGGVFRDRDTEELWTTVASWRGREIDSDEDEWIDGERVIARPAGPAEASEYIEGELRDLAEEIRRAEIEARYQRLAANFVGERVVVPRQPAEQAWVVATTGAVRTRSAAVRVYSVEGQRVAFLEEHDWDMDSVGDTARTCVVTPELIAEAEALGADPARSPWVDKSLEETAKQVTQLNRLVQKREAELAEVQTSVS